MNKKIRIIKSEPLLILAFPLSLIPLLLICLLSPLLKIKIGLLHSDRIGHYAGNTELYLCDKDFRKDTRRSSVDLFYLPRKPCNQQLTIMWKRELIILPWFFMRPLDLIIRSFSCLSSYHAFEAKGGDRDIENLFDKIPPHLQFNIKEKQRGEDGLRDMGVPIGVPFVCLIVRDNAYLNRIYSRGDSDYHDYRDSNIQNYMLAAQELADRGFFVIRMGAAVNKSIVSANPKIIDYASNGMRSDFMDIYLPATCDFCITVGTGLDAVAQLFRRPLVYVNTVPLALINTYQKDVLSIPKKHVLKDSQKILSLSEILFKDLGFCLHGSTYKDKGVDVIENTPEEIRDVVIEMAERLAGTWQSHPEDEGLQNLFWDIFPTNSVGANGVAYHGNIQARYGANFLRQNKEWLN
jgi:putative glycosyltransferase (TIGR04372 family)